MTSIHTHLLAFCAILASAVATRAAIPGDMQTFVEKHCIDCHDADTKKGNLDLTALKFDLANPQNFAAWVGVHDRVKAGEMPPKKKAQPGAAESTAFVNSLAGSLLAAETSSDAKEGRSVQRRLNRYEYENAVRDVLHTPWLQLRDSLPEDREAFRFNKVGDALDVSHVQMARYLSTADSALRQAMATQVDRPATITKKYYARSMGTFTGKMKFTVFNMSPERATFPMLGMKAQPDVRAGKAPITVGAKDPENRELEAMGMVASTYEPIEVKFDGFKAPVSGHYKLKINAFSVWVGPGKGKKWWTPDLDDVSPGRRPEPVTIYSETPPRLLRRLGAFDVTPEPGVHELDVYLLAGETIRPDPARLFRSRPPAWQNPLAEKDGCPGVAFRWLEVKGPIYDEWPTAGHKQLFGDLTMKPSDHSGTPVEIVSKDPKQDAPKLLRAFLQQAYRRPVTEADVQRFLPIVDSALQSGNGFADAMIAAYTGVFSSPGFLYLREQPGKLDDYAIAERLALFLWNSQPDDELRKLATAGKLHLPETLRAQTERLLADPKSEQFLGAFLDYWLDLRKLEATSPDSSLYPDYYLDDLLVESSELETQAFFRELFHKNLPASNIVSSDFVMVNERLAKHYGLPPVDGVTIRRVKLPPDSVRGGLMTQASILKVTANGTTTSPVVRGVWIMERVLGKAPPPPPPSVPAVEPDIRGATTIRAQLDKHRTLESCAACHTKIDPAGFALESFDVAGGFRDRYRASTTDGTAEVGFGHNGQRFHFRKGPEIECFGTLPGGGDFKDIRELKKVILKDEPQIARNLVRQLVVYATGAPVRFGDRAKIEQILDRTRETKFGVKSLISEIVQSELFLNK